MKTWICALLALCLGMAAPAVAQTFEGEATALSGDTLRIGA